MAEPAPVDPPVNYTPGYDPAFDAAAEEFREAGLLAVGPAPQDPQSLVAEGFCPRCHHGFTSLTALSATLVPGQSPSGQGATAPQPRPAAIVACACVQSHEGRPSGLVGCGATFQVAEGEAFTADSVAVRIANRSQFAQLIANADGSLTSSAKAWSAGIVTIVGLVIAGVWVKGPGSLAEMDGGQASRLLIVGGLGLGALILALGLLLYVSAGTPKTLKLSHLETKYGTVANYEETHRKHSAEIVDGARWVGLAGIVLLAVGLGLWVTASPGPLLSVQTSDTTYCGTVKSSDSGTLVLTREDNSKDVTVALSDAKSLAPVSTCKK